MEKLVIQNLPWHALYVNYNFEKKVCQDLQELGIESFLPLYTKVRFYRNHKRKSKIPLISCYVFAKVPVKLRGIVNSIQGVVKFVKFNKEPSVIPPEEIDILKKISGIKCGIEIEHDNYFNIGEEVQIRYGPFAGLEGEIVKKRGKDRLLIKIHSLHQAVSVEINQELLEPINA